MAVTVAVPFFFGSATLVAVTVTIWGAEYWAITQGAGALYKPADVMVPRFGLRDQVTAVLLVFLTVAVNCWVAQGPRTAP